MKGSNNNGRAIMLKTDKAACARMRLVTDRLWLCAEAHNCKKCSVKDRCQSMMDNFPERGYRSPNRVEQFLAKFQGLISNK